MLSALQLATAAMQRTDVSGALYQEILGRDCSPPSPLPATQQARDQAGTFKQLIDNTSLLVRKFDCVSIDTVNVMFSVLAVLSCKMHPNIHTTIMLWMVIRHQHFESALIWTWHIWHHTSECQAAL